MAFKSWKPFYGIIETKKFPHARTLRTSFWQKMQDGFNVIVGDDNHPGLIHYPTFFLILLIDPWFDYAKRGTYDYSSPLLGVYYFAPQLAFSLPLKLAYYIAAYTFAAATMLIASPVVGIVQLASKYFSRDYKIEEALPEIHGVARHGLIEENIDAPSSLQASLNKHHLTVDDITITNVQRKRGTTSCYSYIFSRRPDTDNGSKGYKFQTTLPQSDSDALNSRKNWFAFFELNVANITAYCESIEENDPTQHIVDIFSTLA